MSSGFKKHSPAIALEAQMGPKGCGTERHEIPKTYEGCTSPVAEGENGRVLGPIKSILCRHGHAKSTVQMSLNSCKAVLNPSQKAQTNFSQHNLDIWESIVYPVHSVSCDCIKLPDPEGPARSRPEPAGTLRVWPDHFSETRPCRERFGLREEILGLLKHYH